MELKPITAGTPAPRGARAIIKCDGSCPKNPGPMGIGFHIDVLPTSNATGYRTEYGYRLGDGTNNIAEYQALVASLREALRQGITEVDVYSDSLLIVNHVNGKWETKDGKLKALCTEAIGLSKLFTGFKLSHIPREQNDTADHLSRTPTEPSLPSPSEAPHLHTVEIDITTARKRTMTRGHAALIRYWWVTGKCQNEYRLARIFGGTESSLGKVGRGETYRDVTEHDLPRIR